MDTQLLTELLKQGVGVVVAALALYWKRSDDQAHKAEIEALHTTHVAQLVSIEARHSDELKRVNAGMEAIIDTLLKGQSGIAASLATITSTVERITSNNQLQEKLNDIDQRLLRRK